MTQLKIGDQLRQYTMPYKPHAPYISGANVVEWWSLEEPNQLNSTEQLQYCRLPWSPLIYPPAKPVDDVEPEHYASEQLRSSVLCVQEERSGNAVLEGDFARPFFDSGPEERGDKTEFAESALASPSLDKVTLVSGEGVTLASTLTRPNQSIHSI